jgi:hypothetical protein
MLEVEWTIDCDEEQCEDGHKDNNRNLVDLLYIKDGIADISNDLG